MKELTPEEIRAITESRRGFLKQDASDEPEGYKTDQQKMLPQPPLTKAPVSDARIDLPRDFKPLGLEKDLLNVIFNRCSSRVYTEENLSLLELSFLLWATQGVKGIRGKKYATLRTVPCGGARHPFETYLLVRRVEGLCSIGRSFRTAQSGATAFSATEVPLLIWATWAKTCILRAVL